MALEIRRRLRGIVLPPVERAEKRSIREGDHPSSPSNSAARMAATSLVEKIAVAPNCFQLRHDVGLDEFRFFGGRGGHEPGERLAGFGDFHRLAFGNPRGDARKAVAQISDRCSFHRDTNMYHLFGPVNWLCPKRGMTSRSLTGFYANSLAIVRFCFRISRKLKVKHEPYRMSSVPQPQYHEGDWEVCLTSF